MPLSSSAQDIALAHTLTFAVTPDLPGTIEARPGTEEVTAVRALLVIDGKLHRISLTRDRETGNFLGSFPSPWKRLEYRIQYATLSAGVQLSPNYVADQSCRNSSVLAERTKAEKLTSSREALLKEAILLDDDIRRLNYVERVISDMESGKGSQAAAGGAQ